MHMIQKFSKDDSALVLLLVRRVYCDRGIQHGNGKQELFGEPGGGSRGLVSVSEGWSAYL